MARKRTNKKKIKDDGLVENSAESSPAKGSGVSVCVIFVATICITVLIFQRFKFNMLANLPYESGDWIQDEEMVRLAGDSCDIEQLFASELSQARFDKEFRNKKPVLIKGLIGDWPANAVWKRQVLETRLGHESISSGDGANIVMSGGWSGHSAQTLSDYLRDMENTTEAFKMGDIDVGYDMFNFDADFLSAMPKLKEEFKVPSLFHSWAGRGKRGVSDRSSNPAWSILSLGASRTGLPFHIHGETWLGVVFGRKRWFVYPPGRDAPLSVLKATMFAKPLMSSYQWFTQVRPQLLHLGTGGASGSRPFEFTQSSGDVVYLPPGWKHLTLNMGETIGVGGQTVYDERRRLEESMENLKQTPHDLLSLKSAALSFAQMSMNSQSRESVDMMEDANGMLEVAVELSPAHPEISGLHAELLHMAGQTSKAKQVLQNCASMYDDPIDNTSHAAHGLSLSKLASVRLNFGRAFMAINDPVDALTQLRICIKLAPDLPDAYHTAGAALKLLGRNKEASVEIAKGNNLMRSKPKESR